MRVLFVTNLWPYDERPWHGVFVRNQADALIAAGVQVDVLAMKGHGSDMEYVRAARRALGLNMRGRYDLVHEITAKFLAEHGIGNIQRRSTDNIEFHGVAPQALAAARMMTSPPVEPGTAPLTAIR